MSLIFDGNGIITFNDTSTQTTAGANNYVNRVVFTSPGTYTKGTQLKYIKVYVVGGGGSGGSSKGPSAGVYSGGGGSGGLAIYNAPSANITGPIAVTIGSGGAASPVNNVNNTTTSGNAGGTSSFGSLASATGGNGGTSAAGTGGTGSPAPSNKYPDGGVSCVTGSSGTVGNGSSIGGDGGALPSAIFVGPGPAAGTGPGPTGNPAVPYGYGVGSGGNHITPTTPGVSGPGAPGIVIVEEYY
jgi:hypothetical protein